MTSEGYATGAPILAKALSALRHEEVSAEEGLRWMPLACRMANDVWDDDSWHALSARLIELAREAGALTVLPVALLQGMTIQLLADEFAAAASMAQEAGAVARATRNPEGPYGPLLLAAWRGRDAEAGQLVAAATTEMVARGEGHWLTAAHWATAMLNNGLGRYDEALAAAEQGSEYPGELGLATWSMVELIETASRTGQAERATGALRRLAETTSAAGTDWRWGSWPAHGRYCARASPPSRCTARRSSGSAEPASEWSWLARTCSTANGCGARTAAWTRANSSGTPTKC